MKHEKRTSPVRKSHRAAIDLTTTPSKVEKIIGGSIIRYVKLLRAKALWEEYIAKQLLEGIITEYNNKVTPDEHIENIQLFDSNGDYKLTFERQITRTLDGRAEMAKNLVEQYLGEMENKVGEMDPDTEMVYNLLRTMFFSKRGFKWTPSLNQFLMIDPAKIHDRRLKQAHHMLKESIHIDKSNWYAHVYKYVTDQRTGKGEYRKLELYMIQ